MLAKLFHAVLAEPWLACSRMLTSRVLVWRLRKPAAQPLYEPIPGNLLYVAASCLPYHTSGYTTRTHEVIRALKAAGGQVHALTRPGYPWDRRDRLVDAHNLTTLRDDVLYQHMRQPPNTRPVLQYVQQAAPVVAKIAVQQRAAVIHAASNHVNALPALLAARSLGIPFQYEMRGLWELTRVSRMPSYAGSQAYRQGLGLESLVARHADRLLVISEQLGAYVIKNWGVPAERLTLLPNCIDPARIAPADHQRAEPTTIGYAGSLMSYEGLDTLIQAISLLAERGVDVRAHIVGDGESKEALEEQAKRLGLSAHIRFWGRVTPEAARDIVGRCALVCIPRKPFQVCELIPPIKLVEALALAKPVIVPDLPVFRDELGADPAGWFFKAGDAVDLAQVIDRAFQDHAMLAELGKRAREYAITRRCWRDFMAGVLPAKGMVV